MLGPIFAREWLTLPRRGRHYGMRTAYLGVLWVLGLTVWQASVGWEAPATLGDLARFGLLLFQVLLYVQLTLVMFFSALSAASTITQEKDRRTFILLLLTDLRNHEIVLGKLLGSLLQIGILLVGAVPIYCLNLYLGGVDFEQITQALIVLAGTALAAGSLGGLVALWRDKTFQSLALTVLFLVLYLCIIHALSLAAIWSESVPLLTPKSIEAFQRSLEPFLALQTVIEPPGQGAEALADAYRFGLAMLAFSVVLNGWGMIKLRKWNPSGEPIMQRERPEDLDEKDRALAHAAPGMARPVWANPILWREIATRAYGRRPLMVKAAYIVVLGLVCYYAFAEAPARDWAAARGLVPVAILSLVLVSAQAVTAITSERDVGALDLLLVTDLSPREFIFGKLGGILYNSKEYLIPPLVLAGVYAYHGLLASPSPRLKFENPEAYAFVRQSMNFEAFLAVLGAGLVVEAFALVLGIHIALRTPSSRLAVINTLGTVFFLSVGTLVCIYLIIINGRFEAQWLSFSIFLGTGIGGLWWILSADRPSRALTLASWLCPLAVYYTVTNITIGNQITMESSDPLMPFLVVAGVFGFTIAAMLVPLLSEFDVALGRTTGGGE
jgi:ABC-type transport system involved in multi-copper enzyme maturation permease subunit